MTWRKWGLQVGALTVLSCLLSCQSPRLITQDEGWEYLGQQKVNHLREKDVIQIYSRDKFSKLRLYAFKGNIEIKELEIMLISGDILKPVIDKKILENDKSRLIDLGLEGRQLDHITLRYRSEGKLFSRKAILQVAGRRNDARR